MGNNQNHLAWKNLKIKTVTMDLKFIGQGW